MGGSHETPFKMKGSGFYGLGNSSPAKKTPSATHTHPHLTDAEKLAAAKRRRKEAIKIRQSKYSVTKEQSTKRQKEIEAMSDAEKKKQGIA